MANNAPTWDGKCPLCLELGAKVTRTKDKRIQYRKCECGHNFKTIKNPERPELDDPDGTDQVGP